MLTLEGIIIVLILLGELSLKGISFPLIPIRGQEKWGRMLVAILSTLKLIITTVSLMLEKELSLKGISFLLIFIKKGGQK